MEDCLEARVRQRAERLRKLHQDLGDEAEVEFFGLPIRVQRGVFCPTFGEGSILLAGLLGNVTGKRVLDMGTGTGALALLCARAGATVVAIDVQLEAVRCCRNNVVLLGLDESVDVREGYLFSPLAPFEKFDLVLFNPPFMLGEPRSPIDVAMFDSGWRTLMGFLTGVLAHLSVGGRILVAFSSFGDNEILVRTAKASGMEFDIVLHKDNNRQFYVYSLNAAR